MKWLWLPLVLLVGACNGGATAEYNQALERLSALESTVDDGFDRAHRQNKAIFAKDAWDAPTQLAEALRTARTLMAETIQTQRKRIDRERAILSLELMSNAPETRELYHLDIAAQGAKLAVFEISHEMYDQLLAEVTAANRERFDELAQIYRGGIQVANRRFVELDQARQRRQKQMTGLANPPI